jgi:hypothetical protein
MAQAEAYVVGLNDVLRALKALPKEASAELRDASSRIAKNRNDASMEKRRTILRGPLGSSNR